MKYKNCLNCGKQFEKKPSEAYSVWENKKYCSKECYTPFNKNKFKNGHKPLGRAVKGHKTSEETKKKISQSNKGGKLTQEQRDKMKGRLPWNTGKKRPEISGENSYNWKGGITDENMKIRCSLEYKLWRKACFERDNFTCQKTGQWGGNLQVHHINSFSEFPELRLAIDNGITLSKEAHREFHKLYGKKGNTKEQLNEYLQKR
jgi:hypothetical protein